MALDLAVFEPVVVVVEQQPILPVLFLWVLQLAPASSLEEILSPVR